MLGVRAGGDRTQQESKHHGRDSQRRHREIYPRKVCSLLLYMTSSRTEEHLIFTHADRSRVSPSDSIDR